MRSAISSGHSTGGRTPTIDGKDQTSQDKEEPPVASTRPKQQQLALNFVDNFAGEDEATRDAQEPQGGQSCAAVTEKPALDSLSMNLMEQVVATENMEQAWRNVKANRGAPGPDGITLKQFPEHIRRLPSHGRSPRKVKKLERPTSSLTTWF